MAMSYLKRLLIFFQSYFCHFFLGKLTTTPEAQMQGSALFMYPGVKNITVSSCLICSVPIQC